jgi:branched-chain amino acid transport system permease protein
VSDRPGALTQEFAPEIDEPEATAPAPTRTERLGRMTRAQWGWLVAGLVFIAWSIWGFLDNPTLFVALVGAGVAKGAVVALAAIGFLMIQKATGIANFAQGDLITLGAFLAFWATDQAGLAVNGLGWSLGFGYVLTIVLMFVIGVGIERVAYAPLRGRDIHVVVIATLGVAVIIRTLLALWQGTNPRFLQSWFNPGGDLGDFGPFANGVLTISFEPFGIEDAVISAQRVVVIVVTGVVVVLTMLLFSRTSFGRQVRAIAADRETARLYGVRANRLSMLSFGISAALAGLAGIMIGPLGSFDITLGFTYMLLGFAAAVLGGFGSIGGVVVGALMIGLTEELLGGQLLPMVLGDEALRYRGALPYVLMLVVIAIKPQGLFGGGGRRL